MRDAAVSEEEAAGPLADLLARHLRATAAALAKVRACAPAAGGSTLYEYARLVEPQWKTLCALRAGLAEQYLPRVAPAVVASGALAVHDLAALACASKAWRDAVGPHGAALAALSREDAEERVAGCKAVAARVRAGEGEDEGEAASAAARKKHSE